MKTQCCSQCQDSRAPLICGPCAAQLCKACALQVEDEQFLLSDARPAEITHDTYCEACHQATVAPLLAAYADAAERAGDVNVFYRTQSKESRFIRRTEKPIRIDDCVDRDEAILRLAFRAASAGFNTLVDVETEARKVKNGRWQTSLWTARGVPVRIDPAQLTRRFLHAPN